jgi:hypothetical protein
MIRPVPPTGPPPYPPPSFARSSALGEAEAAILALPTFGEGSDPEYDRGRADGLQEAIEAIRKLRR